MVPPGWYPDPWRVAPFRWWDGYQWTPYLSMWTTTTGQAGGNFYVPTADQVVRSRARSKKLAPWARLSLWVIACLQLGQAALLAFVFGSAFHNLFRTIQQSDPTSSAKLPVGFTDRFLLGGLMIDGVALVTLGVAVAFLMWMHASAVVSRSLGYPARHSPGFGVGSFFIPVVNLWFPYQALSDLLPPGHFSRRYCLPAWITYLAGGVLLATTGDLWAFGGFEAAIVPLVAGAVCWAVAATLGGRLVAAVREDQAQGMARTGLQPAEL